MQSLLLTKLASGRLSTWVSIIMMFTYTILLNRNFECTCKSQEGQCGLYIGLPIVIILLLILCTDRSFKKDCKDLCSWSHGYSWPDTYSFWVSFVFHILKAALVGLLWVAFVLLDGDWYVCCENDHSEQQAPLACKAKDNITEKEKETIAELRNESRVVGIFTLFAIALVVFLMRPFLLLLKRYEGKKVLEEKAKKHKKSTEEVEEILEEGDHELEEILKKSPKDKPTEKDPLDRPSLSSNNDDKELQDQQEEQEEGVDNINIK